MTHNATHRSDPLPWYGLRVKSNREQVSSSVLRGKGYEPFVPAYKVRRRWSDRIKEVEVPLFPGYVFCRLDPMNRLPVLTSPGVVGIVGIGKVPVHIEEHEMQAIQSVVHSGLPVQPWPFTHVGDRVRVADGPLRGAEGIVTSTKERHQFIISITLLQRSVTVEVDPLWLRRM